MRLLRIAARLASRTDVLNQVDAAFLGQDAYAPNMKQTGKDTYEGEIDTGWVLGIVEGKDGLLQVTLNGKPVKGVKEAAIAYKKKDPQFAPAPAAAAASPNTQRAAEQAMYQRTGALPDDEVGSGLFWSALKEMDIHDWTPWTDIESVVKKTLEVAKKLGADEKRAEKEVRNNWQSFKDWAWANEYKDDLIANHPDLAALLPDEFK